MNKDLPSLASGASGDALSFLDPQRISIDYENNSPVMALMASRGVFICEGWPLPASGRLPTGISDSSKPGFRHLQD